VKIDKLQNDLKQKDKQIELLKNKSNFKEYKIPLNVHLNLQAYINAGKKHTILFRQLVKAVIPSTAIWAERTADSLEKEYWKSMQRYF
jgi:hypothetical protein